jgi:hypothetical protein
VAAHTARLALPARFAEEARRDGIRARIAVKEMDSDRGSTRFRVFQFQAELDELETGSGTRPPSTNVTGVHNTSSSARPSAHFHRRSDVIRSMASTSDSPLRACSNISAASWLCGTLGRPMSSE